LPSEPDCSLTGEAAASPTFAAALPPSPFARASEAAEAVVRGRIKSTGNLIKNAFTGLR
jgi:hypothetical protein